MTRRTDEMGQSTPSVRLWIKNRALTLLLFVSLFTGWSVSGLQQTTVSASPLALLSNCCFSNLSLVPRSALGKSRCTSGLSQSYTAEAYRLITAFWERITHVLFGLVKKKKKTTKKKKNDSTWLKPTDPEWGYYDIQRWRIKQVFRSP